MKRLSLGLRDKDGALSVAKILVIVLLVLLMIVPLQMIRALVEERNERRLEAEQEIIWSWGGEQTVGGPVVVVPYMATRKDAEGKTERFVERAYFLPQTLEIRGEALPEERSRGIYEVTLYTSAFAVTGTFRTPDFSEWRVAESDILWEDAALVVELPDMRGLQEKVSLRWDGREIPFAADRGELGVYPGEIRAPLEVGILRAGATHGFALDLHIQGGRSLGFLPLGEETTVRLSSPWPSPSFGGAFLPAERTVGPEGFEAQWYVLSLGRGYPQSWRQGEIDPYTVAGSRFGVDLMTPVDTYMKTLRSVKYGMLFVLLPFLTFFLFEVFSGKRIHPFQYLLVGLAVSLFYLLLLSVSEHLRFGIAYLLASSGLTALITFYSGAVLLSWRRGLVMAPVLGAAYLFLYAALHSEDYALLIGSLGLAVILAGVMILTHKVNWYAPRTRREDGAASG